MLNQLYRDRKFVLLSMVSIAFISILIAGGPIPQPDEYYNFADRRSWLGIPNFLDVISNVAFLLAGLYGLSTFAYKKPTGWLYPLRFSYVVFYLGTMLVAPGSIYFHLNPDSSSLVWDRLPMTIAFMGFFSVIAGEYIHIELGKKILVPLLLFGLFSVFLWRITDYGNGGDLRAYFIVQFLPVLLIPIIISIYPARLKPGVFVWGLLALYVVAKIFEVFDVAIFHTTGIVSGHTLKHLAAAMGVWIFTLGITRRQVG